LFNGDGKSKVPTKQVTVKKKTSKGKPSGLSEADLQSECVYSGSDAQRRWRIDEQ